MPRKSKYATQTPNEQEKRWNPALYIRLSREDGDKEVSDSVQNQQQLLYEFAKCQADMTTPEIYLDDGYTGTNFNRPDFQRMLRDLKAKKVNCVIVKDLSRLGRNYIGVGEYLETIFPLLDVRFIALNDTIDSVKNPQTMNTLMVPFKNIINDEYCRDISNKVRSSLDLKRRQGKFIGSFASYGYKKDTNDHNRLLIDEETAPVIRDIFEWFLSGMSIIGIAKQLNAQGVPNPTAYKQQQGMNYHHPASSKLDGLWPESSVRRILKNKLYTGTMVQGKNKIRSYKLQVSVPVPEQNWIEVEQTHEAIISPDIFEKAQSLFQRDTRTAPGKNRVYLFSGFLRCADCNKAMSRKLISQPYGEYHYYVCTTYKKASKTLCSKHTIRSDRLERAVLETLQEQISIAVEMDELIAKINEATTARREPKRFLATLRTEQDKREQLERMRIDLYPDWKSGVISSEEYQELKKRFAQQIEEIDAHIQTLQAQIEELSTGMNSENSFLRQFTKYRNLQALTREVIVELIDMIYVHEGGTDVTIKFKFSDAYRMATEYIESNATSHAV